VASYNLQIQPADEILSVTGVKAGIPYTWPVGTAIIGGGGVVLFTGDVPDDGTTFYVTYRHTVIREFRGGVFADMISVNVWAQDFVSGTQRINGIIVADRIAEALHTWALLSCELSYGVVVNVSSIRNLDYLLNSEFERRRQFDIYINHNVGVEHQDITIETVERETEVQGP
jgi:hypothetical protein